MQVRISNDMIINNTPRFLTDNPNKFTHSILIPGENTDRPYVIPLALQGVTSNVHLPDQETNDRRVQVSSTFLSHK